MGFANNISHKISPATYLWIGLGNLLHDLSFAKPIVSAQGLFEKYPHLHFTIITKSISKRLKLDIDKYNAQYNNLKIKISGKYHDRFLIIDNDEVYHIGASLKDLGKKIFAFSRIDRGVLRW